MIKFVLLALLLTFLVIQWGECEVHQMSLWGQTVGVLYLVLAHLSFGCWQNNSAIHQKSEFSSLSVFRYFYPFPVGPWLYQVELSIGGQQFHGKGRTRQAAKHDAAAKALKILQNEPLPEKPEVVCLKHLLAPLETLTHWNSLQAGLLVF